MLSYIDQIIAPFVSRVRNDLNLGEEQPALAIFDNFKGQMTEQVFSRLEENNIHSVLVPANCTDRLQPLDLTVNWAIKSFLEREFQTWYAKQVLRQLEDGNAEPLPVDLSSVALKHIGAEWLYRAYEHISNNPHLVVNGFISAGISQIMDTAQSSFLVSVLEDEYDFTSEEELTDE